MQDVQGVCHTTVVHRGCGHRDARAGRRLVSAIGFGATHSSEWVVAAPGPQRAACWTVVCVEGTRRAAMDAYVERRLSEPGLSRRRCKTPAAACCSASRSPSVAAGARALA